MSQNLLKKERDPSILILDFGSQYSELIARRIRETNVFSLVVSNRISIEEILDIQPQGLVLSGGPNSVYDNNAPRLRESTSTMQLAALSGMFAEKLKASPIGEAFILEEINSLSSNLRSHFKNNEKVSDLIQMIQTASNLSN